MKTFSFSFILLVMSGRKEVSTLKTSAPKSARVLEAKGPGSRVEKSKIFKEERGEGILFKSYHSLSNYCL